MKNVSWERILLVGLFLAVIVLSIFLFQKEKKENYQTFENTDIFLSNLSELSEPIIYDKLVFNRTIEQVEVFCYKNNNITDELNCINLSQKDNCQSEFDKCVEVARGLYNLNQKGVCLSD